MFALFSHSTNNLRELFYVDIDLSKAEAQTGDILDNEVTEKKDKRVVFFISMLETGKRITATAHMLYWISWPISKSLHDSNLIITC